MSLYSFNLICLDFRGTDKGFCVPGTYQENNKDKLR